MKKSQKGFTLTEGGILVWLLLIVGIGIGWVMNIIDLIHMGGTPLVITLNLVLRIVGIFVPPLGAIMGYWG